MRLLLERVSTRRTGNEYGVFDETTGKCVGTISFDKVPGAGHKSYPTRTIRLFDFQVRRHLQHAHGMRCLCKGHRSGVELPAEGEGRKERQVASEPHAR